LAVYLDTSALAKLYHREVGSERIEELLQNQTVFLSRLGVVEMQSVLAGKVRTKYLLQSDADLARRRFRSDVRRRRFRVVALRVRHYDLAENLVAVHGYQVGLRTLDSLQLAVALDLQRNGLVDLLVTADKVLAQVAPLEELNCYNPESL
jgi:predicted nucleic acid-binding protein